MLQNRCARCHNERHSGTFQLVVIKARRDHTPDAFRANLDATLHLIDTENPDKSALLSSALVPHPNKQPVFKGANDPEYQILATWVKSLRAPQGSGEVASSRFEARPAPPAVGEGFATDRGAPAPLPFTPTPPAADARPQPPQAINPATPQPPGQVIPGSASGLQPYAPPNTDFPVPYMAGGPRPKLDSTPGPQPGPSSSPPNGPPAGAVPPADAPSAKKPSRPVKIDPALLERALMNRNAPR